MNSKPNRPPLTPETLTGWLHTEPSLTPTEKINLLRTLAGQDIDITPPEAQQPDWLASTFERHAAAQRQQRIDRVRRGYVIVTVACGVCFLLMAVAFVSLTGTG